MSATPTRGDRDAATASAEPGSALKAGNRALQSIAQHEALPALLAFSELHARIRTRRATTQPVPDDLTQTEHFVLDEVLQLICDRGLAITGAHGVLIALAEGTQIVCRASSGSALVERGTRLPIDSEFLAECLVSGEIVRCDDAESDTRVGLDIMRHAGATSSVLIPLRGTNARLGVLQAFSRIPRGFSEKDIRSLDLFAELVLSALKPDDQDRRINWLSDLATEILTPKPASLEPTSAKAAPTALMLPKTTADSKLSAGAHAAEQASKAAAKPVRKEIPLAKLEPLAAKKTEPLAEATPNRGELPAFAAIGGSRPGLSLVIVLVVLAALFAAGVWWGMGVHGTPEAATATVSPAAPTPAPPSAATDNLMDPARFATEVSSSAPPSGKALPKITGVRHWSSAASSTVVLDMEDHVQYEAHRLTSPERIYFDLRDTKLAANLDGQNIDVSDVALNRVRIAQPVPGITRLVLDTKDGANFSVSMQSNPYRLIIDLRADDRAIAANAQSAPLRRLSNAIVSALSPGTKPSDERLAARTGKFRVVIDAGHGGWDLGTVGHQGLMEKDLVLDVSQRLGKLLETRLGAEVVFTRTTDDYLALEQRADLANQVQADLFVSVHANYSSLATARGIETYYSNFFAAPGSKEMVNRENEGITTPVTVSLSAHQLEQKIEQSRHLAANVQRALYATLAAKNPDIRNRGIKDAAFVVLTGTTMPAILTEISFVSSPADEHNLQSDTYRQQIAEALYKGISRYEEFAPHVKIAQLQQASTGR